MAKRQRITIVDDVHVPTSRTREQVCKLVACGLDVHEVAFVLGAMEHEVKEHYAQEFEHGMAFVTALVGGALVKNALGGDTNAQRAFLQMRSRWTVPQHVELTGAGGGPLQIEARKATIKRVLALFDGRQGKTEQGQTVDNGETDAPVA